MSSMIPGVNGNGHEAFELGILTSKPAFIPPHQVPTDNCSRNAIQKIKKNFLKIKKSAYSLGSRPPPPQAPTEVPEPYIHSPLRKKYSSTAPPATQPSLGCAHLRSRCPQRSANTDPSPSRQSGARLQWRFRNSAVYAAQPSFRRLAKPTPVL